MAEDIEVLLANAGRVNWLKTVIVMNLTDESITPFIEEEVNSFHDDITSNFKHGSLCGRCSSTTAARCLVCSAITQQIDSNHRYRNPAYQNSDIKKWLSDPWEIAKCYMSKCKDYVGMPDSEIDFPSRLNVVINNTRFESLEKLKDLDWTEETQNIFHQGRVARNEIMHSKSHQTTETQMIQSCEVFIEIVKKIGKDSVIKKIKTIRDTHLSITKEDIVKLKEEVERAKGVTDEDIESAKTKMWSEAEQVIQHIKDEAEKVNGRSLIANFIHGTKEALYRLTVERIQTQKPDDVAQTDWSVSEFIKYLKLFPETTSLSTRHLKMFFSDTQTEEDIRKWDHFLLCFILQIELRVATGDDVASFVKKALELRDGILHNEVDIKEQIDVLYGFLNDTIKPDVAKIFEEKYTVSDTFHANNALNSWRREEDNAKYSRKDAKNAQRTKIEILILKEKCNRLEQIVAKMDQYLAAEKGYQALIEERSSVEQGVVGGEERETYETEAEIVAKNATPEEIEMVQRMMTSFDKNNMICGKESHRHFKKKTGCDIKANIHGSIIMKVECPTLERLFAFWKGCTDGTVVGALSKVRDAYRTYLKNYELEFDVVLRKKTVIKSTEKICADLNQHLDDLNTKVNEVRKRVMPTGDSGSEMDEEDDKLSQEDPKPLPVDRAPGAGAEAVESAGDSGPEMDVEDEKLSQKDPKPLPVNRAPGARAKAVDSAGDSGPEMDVEDDKLSQKDPKPLPVNRAPGARAKAVESAGDSGSEMDVEDEKLSQEDPNPLPEDAEADVRAKAVDSAVADWKQYVSKLTHPIAEATQMSMSAPMAIIDDPRVREVPQGTQIQKNRKPVEVLKQNLTELTKPLTEVRKQGMSTGIMAEDIKEMLADPGRVNWIKTVKVMNLTDESITPFVERGVNSFHEHIKPKFNLCGGCISTNARNCRNGCNAITQEIELNHRYPHPAYQNSDIKKWLSDPWEIAKCYMSISKDYVGMPDSEMDFPSRLNVVINNTSFENLTELQGLDWTDEANNIFYQARTARNAIMHSKSSQTTDTVMKQRCDVFIEIVKKIGQDRDNIVKTIEKIRDTPLSITAEEFEREKQKMRFEPEQMVRYIKDQAEKLNFIHGTKEALYRLVVKHIQAQKPDEHTDWSVSEFIKYLKIFPERSSLSRRHEQMLFSDTHTTDDIRKWDHFLLCCILQIELHVPTGNDVLLFVKEVLELRNVLLHNPVDIKENMDILCGFLNEPIKGDVAKIFEGKSEMSATFHANNDALNSWLRDEDEFNNARYRRKDAEKDDRRDKEMVAMRNEIDTLKKAVAQLSSQQGLVTVPTEDPASMAEGAVGDEESSVYDTELQLVPTNVSEEKKKQIENMMTSFEENNKICGMGPYDYFKEKTGGAQCKGHSSGSIIMQVQCSSLEELFAFWKGCTDGTVVGALSKVRDAYRKHLKNDKLEFDVVLKKNTVIKTREKIFADLKQNLTELTNQVTEVRKQSMSTAMSRFDDLTEIELPQGTQLQKPAETPAMEISDDPDEVIEVPQRTQIQKPTETPELPMDVDLIDVKYGEEEASRLVKFFTQTAESHEGEAVPIVRPLLQQIVDHAKRSENEKFDNRTREFMAKRVFRAGMSINLIKQIIRGFDMIKEQPEFGDLILSKIDSIKTEPEKRDIQTAIMKEPVFKQSHVKTAVSIAEDTDVDDSDKSKSQGAAAKSPEASTSKMSEIKETMAGDPMTGSPMPGSSKVDVEQTISPVDQSSLLLRRPTKKEVKKVEEEEYGKTMFSPSEEGIGKYSEKMKPFPKEHIKGFKLPGSPMPGSSKVDVEQTISPVDQSSLLLRRPPKKEVKKVEEEEYGKTMFSPSEEGIGKYSEKMKPFQKEHTKGFKPGMTDVPGTETPMNESETQATQKKLGSLQQEEPKS